MVARSLALAAAVFLASMALMALTGAGVNLVTAGHPGGYSMPRPLQWALLGILLIGLIATEAAGARRRLWLALPLVPVALVVELVPSPQFMMTVKSLPSARVLLPVKRPVNPVGL